MGSWDVNRECAELFAARASKLREGVLGQDGQSLAAPGKPFRERYFSFEEGMAALNSAAFGSLPRPLGELRSIWSDYIEREPYRFHKFYMPRLMQEVIKEVRGYLGVAEEHDLVLTPNTSAGIYSVLRALEPLQKGDVILVSPCFVYSEST